MTPTSLPTHSRREWLQRLGVGAAALGLRPPGAAFADQPPPARIAITLDLEMSAQYPRRGNTEWNFEKGNLDEPTKRYALEAARRVSRRGGKVHYFCVGRVLEQADVSWLEEITEMGHPIGNHTYDHVNVLARSADDTQHRFRRAPWLVEGQSAAEIIRHNVRLASVALSQRLGVAPNGFRTPGGFATGLDGREDVQRMLLDLGFSWISSVYPAHSCGTIGTEPAAPVIEDILGAAAAAQPRAYPTGLIEVPMSPVSDVVAFRTHRWQRSWWLAALRRIVDQAIDGGLTFDLLAHPSCLLVEDPEFEVFDMICDVVAAAGPRAELTTLDRIAATVRSNPHRDRGSS
jgi:hypothetical protein